MTGDHEPSVTEMMTGHANATEVILVRLEGKIDRIGDRMDRYERDQSAIRQRIHDLANEVQPIVMLDLPGRIRVADAERAKQDARLSALEVIEHQRKGAAKLAAGLWAFVGVSGAAVIVAVLKLLGVNA